MSLPRPRLDQRRGRVLAEQRGVERCFAVELGRVVSRRASAWGPGSSGLMRRSPGWRGQVAAWAAGRRSGGSAARRCRYQWASSIASTIGPDSASAAKAEEPGQRGPVGAERRRGSPASPMPKIAAANAVRAGEERDGAAGSGGHRAGPNSWRTMPKPNSRSISEPSALNSRKPRHRPGPRGPSRLVLPTPGAPRSAARPPPLAPGPGNLDRRQLLLALEQLGGAVRRSSAVWPDVHLAQNYSVATTLRERLAPLKACRAACGEPDLGRCVGIRARVPAWRCSRRRPAADGRIAADRPVAAQRIVQIAGGAEYTPDVSGNGLGADQPPPGRCTSAPRKASSAATSPASSTTTLAGQLAAARAAADDAAGLDQAERQPRRAPLHRRPRSTTAATAAAPPTLSTPATTATRACTSTSASRAPDGSTGALRTGSRRAPSSTATGTSSPAPTTARTCRFYVDGNQIGARRCRRPGSATKRRSPNRASTSTATRRRPAARTPPDFPGDIDEVRVYNRALSADRARPPRRRARAGRPRPRPRRRRRPSPPRSDPLPGPASTGLDSPQNPPRAGVTDAGYSVLKIGTSGSVSRDER